ncbi:MAG: sulfurtransferase complex subunit TusB [Candidatus Lokiarchaeia archaeon]
MATLILVSKSPYLTKDNVYVFEASLNLKKMNEEVGVLLIQDAVLSAVQGQKGEIEEYVKKNLDAGVIVYVLKPDAVARGIPEERMIKGVQLVDYGEWVDLTMEKYQKIVSWT